MKEKLKKVLQFIANPRLLLCIFIAWMITNGWSYIMLGIGTYFGIGWMNGLYVPFAKEKQELKSELIPALQIFLCFVLNASEKR